MQRYIAFLRGINLGKRRLPMSQLKALFEELGFDDVETFIASGNIVFSSKVTNTSRLESQIAKHLEASLGSKWIPLCAWQKKSPRLGVQRFFQKMARRGLRSMLDIYRKSSRRKLHGRLQPCARPKTSFVS